MDANKVKLEYRSFYVAGVSYRPAEIIDALEKDEEIRFVFEPENPFDPFAIRVECKFEREGEGDSWELIGYVPKKDTGHFHPFRKVGVKLFLKLFVNHDAQDTDKLLVRTYLEGNPAAQFICEKMET